MNVIEISKYNPSLMKNGRYLREDWGSYSNIGQIYNGVALTRGEYLRVENNYLAAINAICDVACVRTLLAHNPERWDTEADTLHALQLDDVLDGSPPVTEGEELNGSRLDNVLRRCLREVAWVELVVPETFLIHIGHDLRVVVALTADPMPARQRIHELGLFVHSGNTRLPTLDEWRFGPQNS